MCNPVDTSDYESNFRSIDEVPLKYRSIFAAYPCFNLVQSKVLDDVLFSDQSLVVSAPTGSGKTVIFELAIVRSLIAFEDTAIFKQFKIIYISPVKALCQERLIDWHKKFSNFGLNCVSITGDTDNVDLPSLLNHNLIITTPEKWDSLTRKWRDNEKLVQVVKLLMIDEVHLLNEDNRGSTLEVLVSRMKTVENFLTKKTVGGDFSKKIRFIALSATVPNIEDIAAWIGPHPMTKYYKFSEEVRPVPLKKIVLGYPYNPQCSTPFKFDIALNYKLQNLIIQYSCGKPTLIFCSTRKSVEMTAKHLVQSLTITLNNDQKQKLITTAALISDFKVRDTLVHGVGYHHAGLIPETRHVIESVFRNGDLPVLVTTSTLALGVNLPAHLVIVKSTKCYNKCGFEDYSETAILQMIGRAGRPQFDDSAVALILTTLNDKNKFERMIVGTQPIESNLHKHLVEHLNAEVVLGTITDLDVALQWLTSSFLYIRATKNPRFYGLPSGLSTKQIDKKLLDMCQIEINKLVKAGMLTMDENIVISATESGAIMAKYCIAFESMKLFTKINGTEILQQILAVISKCHEFSELYLRVDDKRYLNLLNKNSRKQQTLRFPLNGRIKTLDMKINCIIQAVFGCLEIHDHSILADSFRIMRNGERITNCLIEYLQTKSNFYSALLNSIILSKCFRAKLWEDSQYVSKQLTGIGSVMSSQLVNAQKTSFDKILESNPRELELILKKKAPLGDKIIKEVRFLPKYRLMVSKEGDRVKLEVELVNVEDLQDECTVAKSAVMRLLVGSNLNEILLHERYTHAFLIENRVIVKFVDLGVDNLEEVFVHFISEDWVGFDCYQKLVLSEGQSKSSGENPANSKNGTKGPTYIQMFLDMYMKIRKNVPEKPKKAAIKQNLKKIEEEITSKDNEKSNSESSELEARNTEDNVGVSVGEEVQKTTEDHLLEDFEESFVDKREEIENIKPENKLELSKIEEVDPSLFFLSRKYHLEKYQSKPPLAPLKNGTSGQKSNQKQENFVENLEENNICTFSEELPEDLLPEDFDDFWGDPEEDVVKFDDKNELDVAKLAPVEENLNYFTQKYQRSPFEAGNLKKAVPTTFLGNFGKRKLEQEDSAMEFEKSLWQEDNKNHLQKYRNAGKKKLSHLVFNEYKEPDSTVNNELRMFSFSGKKDNKFQEEITPFRKNITWRSPLVFSPKVKFTPKIEVQDRANESGNNETLETSYSSLAKTPRMQRNKNNLMRLPRTQGTKFPLCDEDYNKDKETPKSNLNVSKEDIQERLSDICSSSFLENFGLKSNRETYHPSATDYYQQLVSQGCMKNAEKAPKVAEERIFLENSFESTLINSDFGNCPSVSRGFVDDFKQNSSSDLQFRAVENYRQVKTPNFSPENLENWAQTSLDGFASPSGRIYEEKYNFAGSSGVQRPLAIHQQHFPPQNWQIFQPLPINSGSYPEEIPPSPMKSSVQYPRPFKRDNKNFEKKYYEDVENLSQSQTFDRNPHPYHSYHGYQPTSSMYGGDFYHSENPSKFSRICLPAIGPNQYKSHLHEPNVSNYPGYRGFDMKQPNNSIIDNSDWRGFRRCCSQTRGMFEEDLNGRFGCGENFYRNYPLPQETEVNFALAGSEMRFQPDFRGGSHRFSWTDGRGCLGPPMVERFPVYGGSSNNEKDYVMNRFLHSLSQQGQNDN